MNWDELEKKHMHQWGEFEKLKNESWQLMKKDHDAMRNAFGYKETDIPASVRDRINRDLETYRKQWGLNGEKMSELKTQQKDDIKKIQKQQFISKFKRPGDKSPDKDK